ncbi:MAG: serine hydrolase [Verrucomicrobia bacterium]|nr:serine hydrolase [Verrucomicrobiota bacterium]
MHKKFYLFLIASFLFVCVGAYSAPSQDQLNKVKEAVQSLVDLGKLVGAQLAMGQGDRSLLNENFGVRSIDDDTPVDSETMFCIGSCSKPIASAVVMTLVDDGTLVLDKGIDGWLSAFGSLKTTNGKTARVPTLAELLSHHGGIYSQKKRMTKRQSKWIRDFTLNLGEAVDGIAKEPLYAKPGDEYAYSGAGYCVLGRVAEVATEKSFEALLQSRMCEPLEWTHTSYFPSSSNKNVASGSVNGSISKSTPHLSEPFNLPLIGGSLYSTAADSAVFLQAVLKQATKGDEVLMSSKQFESYTTPYSEKSGYAFGWNQLKANGNVFGLGHSGALASSRALFQINLESGIYLAILYTVSDPGQSIEVGQALSQAFGPVIAP